MFLHLTDPPHSSHLQAQHPKWFPNRSSSLLLQYYLAKKTHHKKHYNNLKAHLLSPWNHITAMNPLLQNSYRLFKKNTVSATLSQHQLPSLSPSQNKPHLLHFKNSRHKISPLLLQLLSSQNWSLQQNRTSHPVTSACPPCATEPPANSDRCHDLAPAGLPLSSPTSHSRDFRAPQPQIASPLRASSLSCSASPFCCTLLLMAGHRWLARALVPPHVVSHSRLLLHSWAQPRGYEGGREEERDF